jgi:hypothetical protein
MLKRPPATPQHPQRSSALLLTSALAPTQPLSSLPTSTDARRTPSRLLTRPISTTAPHSTSRLSQALSANNCRTSARPPLLPSLLVPLPRLLRVCPTQKHPPSFYLVLTRYLDAATGQAAADAFNSALGVSAAKMIKRANANVQTFTGALGGAAPAVIQSSGTRPFAVNGATFVNKAAALQRSCAVQNTACSNAANSGALAGKSVADCNAQEAACNAAA